MGCAVTCRKLHSNSPSRTRFLRRSCNAPLDAVKMQKKSKTTEQKRSHKKQGSSPSLAVARINSPYISKDQQSFQ
ncbi:hypothetical protein ACLKA7_005562 [Drosophila subpalustris]